MGYLFGKELLQRGGATLRNGCFMEANYSLLLNTILDRRIIEDMTHTNTPGDKPLTHQEKVLAKFPADEHPHIKDAFFDEDGLMETMHIEPTEKPQIDEEVAADIHAKIANNALHAKSQIHTAVVGVMLKHIDPEKSVKPDESPSQAA